MRGSRKPAHVEAYLPGALRARGAGRLHPTLPAFLRRPPAGPGWLHEVKHDGYRIIACKKGERVTLWTGYGADFIDRLLTIAWRDRVEAPQRPLSERSEPQLAQVEEPAFVGCDLMPRHCI